MRSARSIWRVWKRLAVERSHRASQELSLAVAVAVVVEANPVAIREDTQVVIMQAVIQAIQKRHSIIRKI